MENRIVKTELVHWKTVAWFQGKLKRLDPEPLARLKRSLKANGFIQPLHVWQESPSQLWFLDGHQRQVAMTQLEEEGERIPELLPANFIDCKDKTEAGRFVLLYSSLYASIDEEGLYRFMADLNLRLDDIKAEIQIPNFDLELFSKSWLTTGELPPIPQGEKAPFEQMSFILTTNQALKVKKAIEEAQELGPFDGTGNENRNGNALERICEAYRPRAKKR